MTKVEFWEHIEAARRDAEGDTERQVELLVERIAALPDEEIIEFERRFSDLINGGCSDDGFDYFRGWLIAQGEAVFENAMKDPDSLADIVTIEDAAEMGVEEEGMLYVAMHAYRKRTGRELYDDMENDPSLPMPPEPGGVPWEDDAELEARYPRLAALVAESDALWQSRQSEEDAEQDAD
jgi:hypothetical protein